MTGPHDSVIGIEIDAALGRFLTALPAKFEPASANPKLHAVIIAADTSTGRAVDIQRLSLGTQELDRLAAMPANVQTRG
jgi:calcineurin-like phosphoesterase